MLYAAGMQQFRIAERLGITQVTVSILLARVRDKLGTRDRRELAALLPSCTIGRKPKVNHIGWQRGTTVRIVAGRYAGREATYVRRANTLQAYVEIGGATMALRRHHLERV